MTFSRSFTATICAAIASMAAASASAVAEDAATFIAEQKPTEYLAKDRLIGAKVHDKDGKIVGDIEDLIIGSDNDVIGVIMGVGGFMSLGEKKVGVTRDALQLEVTDGKMHVVMAAATKEALTSAPAFKRVQPKKGLLERAIEKGEEFRDKSGVTATETYKSVQEKAGPAIESARQKAQEVIDKAKESAQPAN